MLEASENEAVQELNPELALAAGRIAMACMGKDWCNNWLHDNYSRIRLASRRAKKRYQFAISPVRAVLGL